MLIKPVYGRLFFDADKGNGEGGGDTSDGKGGDKGDSGSETKADGGKGKGKEFEPITTQEAFDDAIARRLARHETKLRKDVEAEVRAQIAKDAATAEAAKKGDWEKVATDRQREIDDLKAEIAKRDQGDLRRKVAAANKLPADAAERLKGTTEAELDADAKELAKLIGVREAPNTEAGSGGKGQSQQQRQQGGGQQNQQHQQGQQQQKPATTYDGKPKVAWPNG